MEENIAKERTKIDTLEEQGLELGDPKPTKETWSRTKVDPIIEPFEAAKETPIHPKDEY